MTAGAAITFGSVAGRLGVDVQQVRRWARNEQMSVVQVDHARRVPAEWVAEQERPLAAAGDDHNSR